MEFRFRAGGERDPPFPPSFSPAPPSSDDYFAVQAIRAGFMDFGVAPGSKPSLELLQRELEEERIKEEIIARRIAQRRMIEEQTRREMERTIFIEGFRGDRFREPIVDPLMLRGPQDIMPREIFRPRFVPELEEARFDGGFPLRDVPKVEEIREIPKIQEVEKKSRLTGVGDEFKSITEVNPLNLKLSGMKRKTGTSSGESSSKAPRPATKEWGCALCQVTATCEEALKHHLQGKKHQMKAAQLAANKKSSIAAVKSSSISSHGISTSNLRTVTGKASKQPMGVHGGPRVSVNVNGKLYRVLQKGRNLWCGLCHVKCNSTGMMISHLSGKKHLLVESKNAEETKRIVVEEKQVALQPAAGEEKQ